LFIYTAEGCSLHVRQSDISNTNDFFSPYLFDLLHHFWCEKRETHLHMLYFLAGR